MMPTHYQHPADRVVSPDPVTFIESPELKPVTAASLIIKDAEAATATAATVKVRVQKPYRVIHDGKAHIHPDVVTVPEHLAADWESAQWVKRVQTKKEK
jgi:hypothetical protein